jgi:hypothetical protein
LTEALNWLWSDQFVVDYEEFAKKYPFGSEGRDSVAKICGAFETLGTLYKHGLFNEDLLFDWLVVPMVWERIKGYALGVRQGAGDEAIYENFEALAAAILMAIPSVMVFLSLAMKANLNRWANIILGLLYSLVNITDLIGES